MLEKIRAKREVAIKTEDSSDALLTHDEDNASSVGDSGHSQANMYSAVSPSDVKTLLAEYVSHLYDDIYTP